MAAILAGGVALGDATAHAETPIQLFQRMIAPTVEELRGGPPVRPRGPQVMQPADTSLLAVPMPHMRPEDFAPDTTLGFLPPANPDTIVVPTEDMPMPMPRLRPSIAAPLAADGPTLVSLPAHALAPAAVAAPRAPALVPLSELAEPPPAAQSTCGVSLAMMGVTAVAMEPITEGQCGMSAPVEVAALDGGTIDIRGEAIVNCTMAEAFAGWMEKTVEPLAAHMLNGTLTSVRIAGGYSCRNRNSLVDAKLSEHGKGNAIDIAGFEVDGRWLTVGQASGQDAEFISAVRKSACGPFKTVLGPGSDPYHSDHLHLDLAQRRSTGPSKGLYCH